MVKVVLGVKLCLLVGGKRETAKKVEEMVFMANEGQGEYGHGPGG